MSQPSPVQPQPVLPKRSNRNIAMLLIVAGTVVFLLNSGVFGSIIFSTLLPLVLIAFGFDLLTEGAQRRRTLTGVVLAAVVLMPLMGIAQFMGPERTRDATRSHNQAYIGTVEDIDRVRAHVKLTVGQLSIGRMSRGNNEVVALESEGGQQPQFHRDDRVGFLDIDRPLADDLELMLTQRVPVDLAIEMGTGDAAPLDFEDIKLEKLDFNLGSGNTEIMLPEEGQMEITINVRLTGNVEIDVPDGLDARVEATTRVGTVDVDDRFQLQDGVYLTENYSESADNRAIIRVTSATGDVTIR